MGKKAPEKPFNRNPALERLARQHTLASQERALGVRKTAHFDLDNAELFFNGKKGAKGQWDILGAVVETTLEITVTGASTLELVCHDSEFSLLNDPWFSDWMLEVVAASTEREGNKRAAETENREAILEEENQEARWTLPERPIDINLDGTWMRLAGFKVSEDKLTLLWEDLLAAILRYEKGLVHKTRSGSMTRGKFIHELWQKAVAKHGHLGPWPLAFWCPEENIIQRVEAENEEETPGKGGEGSPTPNEEAGSAENALTNTDGITVAGQPATEAELKVMNEALSEAVKGEAPFKAKVALIEVLINEGDMAAEVPSGPFGISGKSHYVKDNNNVPEATHAFLWSSFEVGLPGAVQLAKEHPDFTAANIAQEVERSSAGAASKGEANFGKWKAEAEKAVNTFSGLKGGTTNTASNTAPFEFTCGKNQTYWDCIQALMQEVGWYAFVRGNCLFVVSGEFLYDQPTRMKIERGKQGVDWVNPSVELGARDSIAEVEALARSSKWMALPGTIGLLAKVGPANGKWLVNSITMELLDPSQAITVKLQKPLPPKREKASSKTTKEKGGKGSAEAAFNAASKLSEMQLPYVFGGGHGPGQLTEVERNGFGLDCSSSTCWILREAGMFPHTQAWDSGELAEKWGDPGEGKEMTVWANADHVFIEFKIPGHNIAQANTNGPQDGPRLYTLSQEKTYNTDPKAEGYTPRHWPGQ